MHVQLGERRALDEPRDEIALGPEERDDLGTHTQPGRDHGRRVLHLPADPEEMRVVAGEADDVALRGAGKVDAVVAVGDAAGERGQREPVVGQLGDAPEHADQVVRHLATCGRRLVAHGHSSGVSAAAQGRRPPRRPRSPAGANVSRSSPRRSRGRARLLAPAAHREQVVRTADDEQRAHHGLVERPARQALESGCRTTAGTR